MLIGEEITETARVYKFEHILWGMSGQQSGGTLIPSEYTESTEMTREKRNIRY